MIGFSLAELSTGLFRSTMQLHVQIQSGATILLPSASGRLGLASSGIGGCQVQVQVALSCTGKMNKAANDSVTAANDFHSPLGVWLKV